jgi:Gluconate 2-dehydrogenase subunit 3
MDSTRRSLLKKGLLGGVLLAVGGGAAIALRPTKKIAVPKRPLKVFTPTEYAIFAAVAERVVRPPKDAPTVAEIDVAARADAAMALAYPSVQKEIRQLLRLFENGLTGLASGAGLAPFTASTRKAQDVRLASWSVSRVPVFRTGFQAMKRLACACYYSSPQTWKSIGYAGPPEIGFPKELEA